MAQKTERRVLRLKSLISHQITEVKDKRRPILNQRNSGILTENKSHEDKHETKKGGHKNHCLVHQWKDVWVQMVRTRKDLEAFCINVQAEVLSLNVAERHT